MKYGMCMDKKLYNILMKYVMYNRTEGNKYWKQNHNADRPTLIFPIHVTRTTGFCVCFVWPNIAYHFQNSTFGMYNVHYVVMIKE